MIKFAATLRQFLFKSPLAIIGTTFPTYKTTFSITDKEDLAFAGKTNI